MRWESNFLSDNQHLELLMSTLSESSLVTLSSPFQNAFHWKYRSSYPGRRSTPLLGALFFSVLALCGAPRPTPAHAVLVESTPAPKSTSAGPDVAIRLRFNVRIDAGRSIITLIRKDGSSAKLQTVKQPAANVLAATGAGLPAGEYRIRWQVLAADGHITSGEIPFSVAAS